MDLSLNDYETDLAKEWVKEVEFRKLGKKTTVALVTIKNDFEIIGTSACVNPDNFNEEIGNYYAYKDALKQLDPLVGFYRQSEGG